MMRPALPAPTRPEPTEQVRCLECDFPADGTAEGWKAYIGGGFDSEPIEVLIYCPECAYREFGVAAF